jgi:hypothetical protein
VADIVLTTFNARWAHASFGLRYLLANLDPSLQCRAQILEFDIQQRTTDVLESIVAKDPTIVAVGVYIWNATQSLQLVGELKRVRPDITIVIGGPEVSHETSQQPICALADYVITGEADLAFAELAEKLLAGQKPLMKILAAPLPDFSQIKLPYVLYTDQDLANRVIYVEASRGCPFKCEFCLSSLDVPVRNVPLEPFLSAMQSLLDRGARQFKFVDRTFNLNLSFSRQILEFFLDRLRPGLFLHFEMIPDRLPEALRDTIRRFPAGTLQFEVGIQTFNEEVSQRISRRQDNTRLSDNLTFLRNETGVHIHADLIVGLPGENLESFGHGFDRLVALRPQEMQIGMLKRLRGTPIVRHDAEFGMIYSPSPPYEILQTRDVDFASMQRMRRFSRYWDLLFNSGNFNRTMEAVLAGRAPFATFLALSDWLYSRAGQTHAISLSALSEMLFCFAIDKLNMPAELAASLIWDDYQRAGRSDRPAFLRGLVPAADTRVRRARAELPPRQARHAR